MFTINADNSRKIFRMLYHEINIGVFFFLHVTKLIPISFAECNETFHAQMIDLNTLYENP